MVTTGSFGSCDSPYPKVQIHAEAGLREQNTGAGGRVREEARSSGLRRAGPCATDNSVEHRKIELGLETAAAIEVRSGLNAGDLVVISGRSSLQPGEEVRPKLTEFKQ